MFVGGRVKEEEGRAFVDLVKATSEEKEETKYRSEGSFATRGDFGVV